jgi:D-aminoacyl-tRNA deacylase
LKAVIQRVSEGGVVIPDEKFAADIGTGMVILLGIKSGDNEDDLNFVADKCSSLRIFNDKEGKINLSVKDIKGEVLIISQFTLYGETAKGNRPSFSSAARPESAEPLYQKFIKRMGENLGESKVKSGIFGAMMSVKIINDGPVTVIVESKNSSVASDEPL